MWTETLTLDAEGRPIGEPVARRPDLLLVFGQTRLFASQHGSAALKSAFPDCHIIGCSTGTTIFDQSLSDEGMTAVAVGFDKTQLVSASVSLDVAKSCEMTGIELGEKLKGPNLKAIFVLSEGLNVNGSELVAGLSKVLGPEVRISGGLAGDGARFGETYVLSQGVPQQRMVTAIGFYGTHLHVGHGSAGGWDAFGPKRLITRAEGNVLYELDGKPALDLYERYLGEEAANLPASGLFYPLKIMDPAHPEDKKVRTILSVDHEARSLTFAGDIPQGWQARLMQGDFARLVEGAEAAADQALSTLQNGDASITPSLSLLVSCVGRRLLMGQRTEEEVQAVTKKLGQNAAQIGFYSYGEIAPQAPGGASALHNQTVTITLLAEAA